MPRLIGYHGYVKDGIGFIVNNDGDIRRESSFMDWLLDDKKEEDGHKKVVYDLDGFVAVLCRLIDFTEQEAETLIAKGKLHIPPYDLNYYPGKYFSISKGTGWGRPYIGFYNMEQYFDTPRVEDNPSVDYAVGKAQEARDMGSRVSKIFYALGWDGTALTSPISSLEKSVIKGLSLPSHKDIPEGANDLALKCCKGPWVEAFQVGYWPKAYDYDLVSAYPFALSKLLDLRRGDWVLSPEKPEGAVYGFLDGELTYESPICPILYNTGEDDDYTTSPTGTRPEQITNIDYDFLYEYKQGEFKVRTGWWWIPKAGPQYEVLKGIVSWLYKQREGADELTNKLVKRAMSGLWGKTLSVWSDGQYSPTFNPPWGALVESRTRVTVAKFILDNKLTPIHIAVDGVIAPQKVKLPPPGGMGTWRMSHTGGVLVLSSGVVAVEGKEGAEDFSLKYDWLKNEIGKNPEATGFEMSKPSICTLANALATKFEKLGEVETITKTILVQVDGKRLYWDTPKKAGDLLEKHYESEPMDMAVILGQEVR